MGYSEDSKAYRLVDVLTSKITISRDVQFLQCNEQIQMQNNTNATSEDNEIPIPLFESTTDEELTADSDVDPDEVSIDSTTTDTSDQYEWEDAPVADEEMLRRSKRTTQGKLPMRYAFLAETEFQEEPKTLAEALASPDSSNWRKAMHEELGAMKRKIPGS
ncbi:uncharacterized protein LOC128302754 [Anopheles moucheti]|uniref:uncharacterized protein LOC128302754 n=1 Tax=Anopheles moucheti TaxID=186751 RepID=UPI0022F0C237|nr:uncharacterized protein LOC128302754 [Anopheles moucheti]